MKLLNRLPKEQKITGVVKIGGYYRWDWKFPFRHFVEEKGYIFTENSIYTLSDDPNFTKYLK